MSSRVRKNHTRELSQDKNIPFPCQHLFRERRLRGLRLVRKDGNRDVRSPVKNGRPRSPATKTNSFLVDAATATNDLPVVR